MGLRGTQRARRILRLWAFVVLGADFADFGDMTDTELGDQIVSLLWDAAAGTDPATVEAELARLGFGARDVDDAFEDVRT